MNDPTNPNTPFNGVRPTVDPRVRIGAGTVVPGVGPAPQAAPMAAPAAAATAAAAPRPMATGTPATAPTPSTATAATVSPVPRATATAATPTAASTAAASTAAPAMLDKVVQGAHDTVDRVAESAAPVVRRLGERVSATEDALHAGTDHLRQVRDEWTAGMRSRVRDNPLACVAGALALGAVIARLRR